MNISRKSNTEVKWISNLIQAVATIYTKKTNKKQKNKKTNKKTKKNRHR